MNDMIKQFFTDIVKKLTKAKIPISGVQGWVFHGPVFQIAFFEIEKSVLSLILKYPDERQKAFRLLCADDFYLEAHRVVFEKCHELHRKGVPVGIDNVYAELDESQREIIQPTKLARIIDSPPSVDIAHHSKILKDTHQRRTQIEIGNAIIKNAYKADTDKINK